MRKSFFVLAAVACCACSKGVADSSCVKDEVVELNFSVPVMATRASGSVTEDAVESLQVFVFGSDGQVQSSGIAEENSLTLMCTTGEKKVAAIVNSSPVEGVNNIAELEGRMSGFGDNSLGCFAMSGLASKTLSASGTVEIPVKRLVSKVTLSSVSRDFRLEQHQNMDFELMSVFLTNTPQQIGYFKPQQSDELINVGESDMETIAASGELLYDDLGEVGVGQGETAEVGNFLYCYPNMLADPAQPDYVVVQTRLGDVIYYYSVALPAMESNKCYNVSLTVTMPGSLTPDVPVKKEDAQFRVSVGEWDGNVDVDETI